MSRSDLTRRELLRAAGAAVLAGAVRAGGQAEAMILIPLGPFLQGTSPEQAAALAQQYGHHPSWLAGEVPQRQVNLPAYRIDRCPVTHGDYLAFVRATGHRRAGVWPGAEPPAHLLDHPVAGVDAADAEAYARWAGKRLPTEAEWEKAARGAEGRVFPWGDTFDPDACQWNREDRGDRFLDTAPVTAHPRGASPYGVLDMVGNLAEWCADGPGPSARYVKGGSFVNTSPLHLRPADRSLSGWANNPMAFYGFRCAKDAA